MGRADFATYLASGGDDYFQVQQVGALYAKEHGLSGGEAAYTAIFGLHGGKRLTGAFRCRWQVELRRFVFVATASQHLAVFAKNIDRARLG